MAEGYSSSSLDRTIYPRDALVHLTISDLWLNIDPTDEDSWTFAANSTNSTSFGTYYQVFNENGGSEADLTTSGVINIKSNLGALMIETQGLLILDTNAQSATNNVVTIQDNDDSGLTCVSSGKANTCRTLGGLTNGQLLANTLPITITEQGPNSGIFGTYDESDTVFAYQVGAGVAYNFAPQTAVNAQYRFMGTTDPEFSDDTVAIDMEYQSHNFWVGLTQRF